MHLLTTLVNTRNHLKGIFTWARRYPLCETHKFGLSYSSVSWVLLLFWRDPPSRWQLSVCQERPWGLPHHSRNALLSPSPILSHTAVLCPHGNSLCWLPGSEELPLISSTRSLHFLPTTHCLHPAFVSIYCNVPERDSHLCPLGSREHTHW